MMLVHLKLMWLMYQVLLFNPIKEGQCSTAWNFQVWAHGLAFKAKSWVKLPFGLCFKKLDAIE